MLIGRDVLPTSVRESKSVTCRLRYGTEKTAKLIDDSGNEIDDLKYDESNEALKRLKKLIKGDEAVLGLSYIDIFLDEVFLQVSYAFNYVCSIIACFNFTSQANDNLRYIPFH